MTPTRIVVETSQVGAIPLLSIASEAAQRAPLVLWMHGMGGEKRHGLEFGYRLAEAGCFFLAFDAPMHGERLHERIANPRLPQPGGAYPPDSGLDYWYLMLELVVEAAQEVDSLLAHFAADPRVDVTHLGVSGVSMGGYWAHYMAAHHPSVRVAVPVIGLPTFAWRWENLIWEVASYPQWAAGLPAAQVETEQRAAFLRSIDPFERLAGFAPKPLLMLNGDADVDQPKIYSVRLLQALSPLYAAHPERLRLSIHDFVAHQFTPAMMDEAVAWFQRYL